MDAYERTKATYKQSAEELNQYYLNSGARKTHIEKILNLAPEHPKVLELGCGPGRDAEIIAPLAGEYTGIDYSSEFIQIARAKLPTANFICGDMVTAPYPDGCDIVFSFASFLHLNMEQLEKVFAKTHAALATDGVFYISTKLGTGTSVKEDKYGWRKFYLYQIEDLEQLSKGKFNLLFHELEQIHGSDWLEVCLQKI